MMNSSGMGVPLLAVTYWIQFCALRNLSRCDAETPKRAAVMKPLSNSRVTSSLRVLISSPPSDWGRNSISLIAFWLRKVRSAVDRLNHVSFPSVGSMLALPGDAHCVCHLDQSWLYVV